MIGRNETFIKKFKRLFYESPKVEITLLLTKDVLLKHGDRVIIDLEKNTVKHIERYEKDGVIFTTCSMVNDNPNGFNIIKNG